MGDSRDSELTIDWTAVRQAALDCVEATSGLLHWAAWSQQDDYDVERAAVHLEVIRYASETYLRTERVLDGVFEPLLLKLATVSKEPWPDFQFGFVCCSTAHETAHELLRMALLRMQFGVLRMLKRRRLDPQSLSIAALDALSPEDLQKTLSRWQEKEPLEKVVGMDAINRVGAWIHREWAAVTRLPNHDQERLTQETLHSPDFRSVNWFGRKYTFTGTQAACVKLLWENWEQGTPELAEPTILDSAGTSGDRLRDVFDKGKHDAWGTMIVPGTRKGTFRLAEPDRQS